MDERDKKFDANLRAFGQQVAKPAQASDERINRWVALAQAEASKADVAKPATRPIRHRLRVWISTSAAAAVLLMAVLVGHFATSPVISADELFDNVGNTIEARPVISLTAKNIVHDGHRLDIEFRGTELGQALYAKVRVRPIEQAMNIANVSVDMVLARHDGDAWILFKELTCNGESPLAGLMPEGGKLLIRWPVSAAADEAVMDALPLFVRLGDVRGLVESLRKAVPNLAAKPQPDGLVQFEGVITNSDALDVSVLRDAVDVASLAGRIAPGGQDNQITRQRIKQISQLAKIAMAGSLKKDSFKQACQQVDMLADTAIQQVRLQRGLVPEGKFRQQNKQINSILRKMLAGSQLKVAYDPAEKLLYGLHLDKLSPNDGSIDIRFATEDAFDSSLLDSKSFENDPNVRVVSKMQLLQSILLPLLN